MHKNNQITPKKYSRVPKNVLTHETELKNDGKGERGRVGCGRRRVQNEKHKNKHKGVTTKQQANIDRMKLGQRNYKSTIKQHSQPQ